MPNNNTAQTLDPIDMQSWSPEQLLEKAKELGVTIAEETTEAAEIIAAIVESTVANTSVSNEPEVGQLVSIHSRTDEAKALVLAARNHIHANSDKDVSFKLFLADRDGNYYQRVAEGVRCSRPSMQKVLDIITPLPDGSQDEMLQEYRDNPDAFQEPLLVRLRRRNGGQDSSSYGHYVMLYLRKKQDQMTEQVF